MTNTLDSTKRAQLEQLCQDAAKARRDGITLYRDRERGAYYASSASTPGYLHRVTLWSCDCRGFIVHGHCKHHGALAVAHLLQDGIDPDAELQRLACPTCAGEGTVEAERSRWVGGGKLGYRHSWTVPSPCPTCDPAEVAA